MITCMLNSGLYVHGCEKYLVILEWIEVMEFAANSFPRITHLSSLKPAKLEISPPAGHGTTKWGTTPLTLVVP